MDWRETEGAWIKGPKPTLFKGLRVLRDWRYWCIVLIVTVLATQCG